MELKRVGLFGARFTMQGRFYPDLFTRAGITLAAPAHEEQTYIHDKYMNELVNGIFLPETREGLLRIAERLKARDGIEGLILGGTELPLILKEVKGVGIPFLDMTRLHVEKIVSQVLSLRLPNNSRTGVDEVVYHRLLGEDYGQGLLWARKKARARAALIITEMESERTLTTTQIVAWDRGVKRDY